MRKVKAAIIGSGNIGTDLMIKMLRSKYLDLVMLAGIDPASQGLAMARERGLKTTVDGIDGLLRDAPEAEIVFDATSAKAHIRTAKALREAGKHSVDLTPAARGPYVVPMVNLHFNLDEPDVNMVSCGGQATIPIVSAVNSVSPVEYAEIVATIASKSAGPGTRANIDEFTATTAEGVRKVGGARRSKAIIILNPAEPPIMMRNTVYCVVEKLDKEAITASIERMVQEVQKYVPGYRIRSRPIFEEAARKVTVFVQVEGAGDFLPTYAGNLDIMTSAALKVGEELAKHVAATKKETVHA
ncbi:MAG: acetaldehyde dehydrogenase (acetylating) [Chloroflexota bacterium]|nr:acetaldehyde dehydrogenase (acetylating) [Chloroflexota bacterium]